MARARIVCVYHTISSRPTLRTALRIYRELQIAPSLCFAAKALYSRYRRPARVVQGGEERCLPTEVEQRYGYAGLQHVRRDVGFPSTVESNGMISINCKARGRSFHVAPPPPAIRKSRRCSRQLGGRPLSFSRYDVMNSYNNN